MYNNLPSSDHTFEEFTTYVNELDCTICAYQTQGPVVIAGDIINAHLLNICSTPNPQGNLIHDLIDRNHLYPVLSSRSLNYTYFSGSCRSIIDHIFVDVAMVSNVISCEIMDHHPLNLSDHLPVSILIRTTELKHSLSPSPSLSINWSKAVSDGSVHMYTEQVRSYITTLLDTHLCTIADVDKEIRSVASLLIHAAQNNLPFVKPPRKRFILNHKLSALCKLNKIIWRCWKDAGRPNYGPLYSEMKESRRTVKKHIATCRAQRERSDIQKRDLLFKNCSNYRFRIFKSHSVCSKLLDNNNQPVTDPIEIAKFFKSYFSLLASSNIQTSAPVSAAA